MTVNQASGERQVNRISQKYRYGPIIAELAVICSSTGHERSLPEPQTDPIRIRLVVGWPLSGHPLWRDREPPGTMESPTEIGDIPMKKLLLLAILGGIGYLVYRQYMASQAEQDLWAEATAAPDLR